MQDHTNVIGRRVGAYVIDAVLYLVIYGFIWQSQAKFVDTDKVPGADCDTVSDSFDVSQCLELGDRVYYVTGGRAGVVFALGLAVGFLYLVVLQGLTGWTVGKVLTGIRTVRDDGRAPGIGKAALRWVLLLVDSFPYVAPLVGFITSLTTQGHRRVGDMAAKTFVVHKAAAGQPVIVPGLTTPAGYGQAWGPPPGQPGAWGATPPPAPGPQWGQPAAPPASTPPASAPADDPAGAGWAVPSDVETPDPAQQQPAETPEPAQQQPAETPELAQQRPAETPGPAQQQPAAPAPSASGPQWDEARGTYIQWDPNQAKWLQWDESGRAWQVIPGQ